MSSKNLSLSGRAPGISTFWWQRPGESGVSESYNSKLLTFFQSSWCLLFTWQYSVPEEFVYKQMFVKVSVENISTVRTHHTSLQSVVNWPVFRPSFNPINYIIYDLITLFFFNVKLALILYHNNFIRRNIFEFILHLNIGMNSGKCCWSLVLLILLHKFNLHL